MKLGAVLIIFSLLGCAAKKPISTTQHINLIVRPECLTKPVVLVDCKDSEAQNCRGAKVSFNPKCADVQVTK